jgi:hypothetical protein
VAGSSGTSFTTFLEKIGVDGRAYVAVLNLTGTNFWMYNSLRRVIGELVGLRRLTIRMHVGHLVTFDGYLAIRDCVVDDW